MARIGARVYDVIDASAKASFDDTGWVLTRTPGLDAATLRRWSDEVASLPQGGGDWLQHRELTDDGPKLCRSENFVPFHDGLRTFLTTGPMLAAAAALLGEPAVLYKEKINYKLAGGAGFAPHQDAPAYPFVHRHVSCMVAVDDATVDNGCLDVVSRCHHEVLPMDERGCIRADVAATLLFVPLELRAGDTLWFHSRTPHRSGANRSAHARRAIFPTYNAAAEGDLHAAYYERKRREFTEASSDPDRARVSLIGDFEGRAVD